MLLGGGEGINSSRSNQKNKNHLYPNFASLASTVDDVRQSLINMLISTSEAASRELNWITSAYVYVSKNRLRPENSETHVPTAFGFCSGFQAQTNNSQHLPSTYRYQTIYTWESPGQVTNLGSVCCKQHFP